MEQGRKHMRKLVGCACMLSAMIIGTLPVTAYSDTTQNAIIATAAADYSSGAHCIADVEPVGGPRTIQTNLLPTISDIMVAAYEDYFYRIERYQRDNITKFDIAAPDTPVYQYSVLDSGETGSANPHAMIFLNSEKAYLLRYGKAKAWIVNPSAETEAAFKQIGLVRSRHLYALKLAGELKVVFIINITDIGLNMSDLTNSVKIIVLEQEGLDYRIIRACLLDLFQKFQLDEMPVLTFPASKATELDIPFEKIYNLWILSMNHTDDYFRYLKRLLKFIKH